MTAKPNFALLGIVMAAAVEASVREDLITPEDGIGLLGPMIVGSLSTEQRATIETSAPGSPLVCAGCDQQSETTRMRFVITRVDGRRVGQSINYCDACTEIVNRGGHDVHERATERVTFPRAESEAHGPGYLMQYAFDCRKLMRAWLVAALTDFCDLFDLNGDTENDASLAAEEIAVREIGRKLNRNEQHLLNSALNDLVVAGVAMRKRERDVEQARQAELAREVL